MGMINSMASGIMQMKAMKRSKQEEERMLRELKIISEKKREFEDIKYATDVDDASRTYRATDAAGRTATAAAGITLDEGQAASVASETAAAHRRNLRKLAFGHDVEKFNIKIQESMRRHETISASSATQSRLTGQILGSVTQAGQGFANIFTPGQGARSFF